MFLEHIARIALVGHIVHIAVLERTILVLGLLAGPYTMVVDKFVGHKFVEQRGFSRSYHGVMDNHHNIGMVAGLDMRFVRHMDKHSSVVVVEQLELRS